MPTVNSIMADLKKRQELYARHGNDGERTLGVSVADLKTIAKTIKGQQALACEFYETGNLDAMYLAGRVAVATQMTKKQLQDWADSASGHQMVSVYTVPWVDR